MSRFDIRVTDAKVSAPLVCAQYSSPQHQLQRNNST